MSTPTLELRNVRKSYGGNAVLKGVSFALKPGEIRGLIGENGAGKSTLMNILFGMPVIHNTGGFEGEVLFQGKPAGISSPKQALALGIGMVHQEFTLIPELTIAENIKLNREPTKHSFIDKVLPKKLELLDLPRIQKESRAALDAVGLNIDEMLPVAGLPVGHMQFIEIAREIDSTKLNVLVFDEPTAVLCESEAEQLLTTMRLLAKEKNTAILFITHRLAEIESVCDTITILRDGELVGNYQANELSQERMAELMIGRKVSISEARPERQFTEDCILELRNFGVDMPGEKLKDVTLKVRRGEILGVAGLAGQGKIGLANGIAGLFPYNGEAFKDGKALPVGDPSGVLNCKIAFLSEDRRGTGLLLESSITENITLPAITNQSQFLKTGALKWLSLVDTQSTKSQANKMIKDLDVRCRSPKQKVRELSGGNQQKVCMARAITLAPDLLLVSEPTRGVDIQAKSLLLETLIELNRKHGTTIIITSSELAELRSISDRIAVIAEGKVSAILSPFAPDKDFGLAMSV